MPLKLMYITKDPETAKIAESVSVDRIFIDLELRGKVERQGHLDTVISHHSISDVKKIKEVLNKSKLLVRVNSIYENSENEIIEVINSGADIVMLPYFKTADEVRRFVDYVGGRAKVCLLCETPEAVNNIDQILSVPGIDEIHIGLNDLHLGYKMKFMFELLANGTVEELCKKFSAKGIDYGFGGVGRVGSTDVPLPAEYIVNEHYRLGSKMVILSRAFCDTSKIPQDEIYSRFSDGAKAFREYEKKAAQMSSEELKLSHDKLVESVENIIAKN